MERIGEGWLGQAELPLVDASVEAGRELVALEAFYALLLGDDVWRLSGIEPGPKTKRVVEVAVRIDRGG